jgi:hypothetical protein
LSDDTDLYWKAGLDGRVVNLSHEQPKRIVPVDPGSVGKLHVFRSIPLVMRLCVQRRSKIY